MLQTRSGKRTAKAAVRIAVELVNEGLISKKDAVSRIDPASLDQLLHPTIDPGAKRDVIATGLPASPGAASGDIVFSADEAEKLQADGRKVILVRTRPVPKTSMACIAAEGHSHHPWRHDLARRGGRARHGQALRGRLRLLSASITAVGTMQRRRPRTFKTGDVITIDGSTGEVLVGRMPMVPPE